MRYEILLGVTIIGALTFYGLLGGADYGGGIWDLFSAGPRGQEQRDTVSQAITPVWEVNHVWLVLVIVLLWTGVPPAFAAVTTALHIPVLLLLFGVIFRGVCFTFRNYDTRGAKIQRMWGLVFSIASLITPFLLGVIVGAITQGKVLIENGASVFGYIEPWFTPFSFVVGGFAVALFAYLAAAYLTVEASTPELQDDFRKRAIIAGFVVAGFAVLTYVVAMKEAPEVCAALVGRPWSLFEQSFTAIASLTAFWSLFRRRFYLARFAVAAQTTLILWGWALAQYPFVVRPGLTLSNSAAPEVVVKSLLIACAAGALLLFPSIAYLYKVFKTPAMIHDEVTH